MSYFASPLSSAFGIASGILLSVPTAILGSGIADMIAIKTNQTTENEERMSGAGGVLALSLLSYALDSSPFSHGVQVTAAATSALVGTFFGLTTAVEVTKKITHVHQSGGQVLFFTAAGAVCGLVSGAISSSLINATAGCILAGLSSFAITRIGCIGYRPTVNLV